MLRGLLLPDWVLQVASFIIGPLIVILLLRIGITQLKKFGEFVQIRVEKPGWRDDAQHWRSRKHRPAPPDDRPTLPDNPDLPKHEPKIMFYSMIKFLICLFCLTFATFGVLVFPMIAVWALFIIYIARKYIVLWKGHKYSVPFLIAVSLGSIAVSFFVSPFLRAFLVMIGRIII